MTTIDLSTVSWLDRHGITEARHFTMSNNLLGILSSGWLYSRARLPEDHLVGLVAANNCYRRWDAAWFGHVNLSVQRINGYLHGISSGKWHAGEPDLWWAVLGFDREILAHPDVVFVTTNNGYSVARRGKGLSALEDLFADEVVTWGGGAPAIVARVGRQENQTTDPQAEALYPEAVSVEYLRTIYVPQPALTDTVAGWLDVTGRGGIEILFDPEAFA